MIWCKHFALLAFVLVLTVSSSALSQDKKTTTVAAEPPQDEDTIDLTPPALLTTEKDEDERGAGQIVGQSLVPQLLGQSFVPRPLNLFSAMFPALNSLLLMGNLFPAASLLGTPSLLGSTHQLGPAQNDEVPADSKVVLVLAEDRNPHAAMRAAHQEAARTIRQNDMFSQLLAQFGQADFGQMLSQSLEQMQQPNANPLLQQFVPQEFSQAMGQLLSQTFQQFPGLDLSQLPMLGQAPPAADSSVGSALPQAEGEAAASAGDAAPPTTGFQFPNFQSAIDAGTQLLGQALQQPTGDPSSGFQLPNFQSAFDAGSQMLGQAFQQANGDALAGFQLPNLQSVIDTGNQMLSQGGSLFNLRPLQSLDASASASDAESAASQISEVRVKPDTISSDHPSAHEMQKDVNMDELKMTSALQKALLHKKLPILWFRIPADSLEKDHDLETKTANASKLKNVDEKQLQTKLQAFQRQVITELKLLQDIERQAKEMRAASIGATSKNLKDNANTQSSMLSKIPIHKITRSDIEKALNDDYVKKLLHKAAIANRKEAGKTTIYAPSGVNIKRQTSKSKITPRQMTREDIVRMMAYAYRMANANGIRMLETPESKKPTSDNESDGNHTSGDTSKTTERKWPSGAKTSMERQWVEEEKQIPDTKTFQQDPTLMHADRQMQQNMGRQWIDEQKPHTNQPQALPILEPHRQALEDNPQMNTQRQWVDHKSDMLNWMQENSQMPMQRQWVDNPSMPPMSSQKADGRMWAEQQPQVAMQQPMIMPQMSMVMMQQPQMELQQMPMQQPQMVAQQTPMGQMPMMMQQPQMVAQQTPMELQQMPMQQPQMVAQQTPMEQMPMMMQQPQMVAQQTPIWQMPMMMQQPQMVAQQTPMELQHMQMQQPQMVAQQTPMGQTPMMMQQPQVAMQEPPMLMQHTPMTMQQPQGELPQMGAQGDTMMLEQMSPDMQRQTHEQDMVGEAMPQMPENTGKARFKGGSIFDELDMFGLGGGGDKKKKGKGKPAVRPTIINYYYNTGGRPATYGSGGYSGGSVSYGTSSKPSYGASYGGGASGGYGAPTPYGGSMPSYGSYSAGASYSSAGYAAPSTGSYRTAVGDDEIQAMLREHTHMKMMSDSDLKPVTIAVVPTTTTYHATSTATEDNKQNPLPLQTETSSISHNSNSTTTTTTITTTVNPPTTTSSKLSRLDCKLRLNSILGKGKTYKDDCVRHKRNANYGTLQAIDAHSLNELRQTYKDSLKEITLNPEEDPAEALMRYNAASIRAALEQANQAPMEVSTDDENASTIETHNNGAYYDGDHMPVLNQIHAHPHAFSESNLYLANEHSPRNNYKVIDNVVREPVNVAPQIPQQEIVQQRSDKTREHEQEYKILIRKQDHIKPIDNKIFSPVITDSDVPQHTNVSKASETQTMAPGSSESELRAVLELIKQQMQTCCDKCRDRILGNIKANIKESLQRENPLYDEATRKHSKTAVSAVKSNSKRCRDDEQFEKWLRDMEAKGYESKYLTRSHHWQYLNSGKLVLAVESNEYDQQIDNQVSKKTNEQSFKRFTPPSFPIHADERKSKKLNMSNKSKGKAFGKKLPEINYSIKEHVHVVNDELRHLKQYSEEVSPSPYAMRGKFKSSSVKKLSDSTAVTTPVKFNAMSQQRSPLGNIADKNKAKVVELLSLLYDLSPRIESTTNSKPTQLSVVVMPIVPATSTASPVQVATTIRARTKRMRSRRKQKVENDVPTKIEQSSAGKR